MAEVLARSQETTRTTTSYTPPVNDDVSDDDDVYELMTLAELKDELDNHTDFDERAKIRKAIRAIKNKKISSNKKELGKTCQSKQTPLPSNGSAPFVKHQPPKFEVKTPETTNTNKPWLGEVKKNSFRSVSTKKFTPPAQTSQKPELASAPSLFSSVQQEKKADFTPISRFGRREFSGSLRNYKPSYKPPDHVINRAGSLKLARPRDFTAANNNKTSAKVLHSQSVTPPRLILESVVPQNISVDSATTGSPVIQKRASITSIEFEDTEQPETQVEETLNRSESQKENDTAPSIPVVPGNKRRSRGILGRVLSFKIDSEKVTTPHRVQVPPTVDKVSETPDNSGLPTKKLDSLEVLVSKKVVKLESPKTPDNVPIVPIVASKSPAVQVTCTFKASEVSKSKEFDPVDNSVQAEQKANSSKVIEDFVEELIQKVIKNLTNSPLVTSQSQTNSSNLKLGSKRTKPTLENLKTVLDDDSSSTETDQSESEDESRESSSNQSQSSNALSNSDYSDEEEDMEGRRTRARYGGNAGSVKSRILATEDPNSTKKVVDVEKLKKQRQDADARVFKRSEGVRSRMNRFSSKAENDEPKLNGLEKSKVSQNEENSISSRYRRNKEVSTSTLERKNKFEINNNDVSTPKKVTSSTRKSADKTASEKALERLEAASKSVIDDMKTTSQSPKLRNNDKDDVIVSVTEPKPASFEVEFKVNKNEEKSSNSSEMSSPLDDATESIESKDKIEIVEDKNEISEIIKIPKENGTENGPTQVNVITEDLKVDEAFEKILETEITSSTEMKSNSEELKPDTEATTLCDATQNNNVVTEEKRPRARRQRRSERLSASKTPDETDVTIKSEKSRDVDQSEAPKEESVTERRRRRRRARKEGKDAGSVTSSASTSAASTPDKESNEIAEAPKTDVAVETTKTSDDVTVSESSKVVDDVTPIVPEIIVEAEKEEEVATLASDAYEIQSLSESQVTSIVTIEEKAFDLNENNSHICGTNIMLSREENDNTTKLIETIEVTVEEEIIDDKVVEIKEEIIIEKDLTEIDSSKKKAKKEKDSKKKKSKKVDKKPKEEKKEIEKPKTEDSTQKENTVKTPEPKSEMRYTIDNISDVTDEAVLEKLLDQAEEYEDRKKIRAAMRELRRKFREAYILKPKDKETKSWKTSKTTTTATGVRGSTPDRYTSVTKTTTTTEIKTKDSLKPSSGNARKTESSLGSIKPMEMTPQMAKSLAEKYSISPSLLRKDKMASTGTKKIGSIFDREEEAPKKTGSKLDLERRQAERRRDLTRNRSMPASSSKDARKMFVAKLEGNSDNKGTGKKVGRSPTFVVPNANNVKQMLLKWCQAKTRGYDNVEINNFSGSWANGLAFCALVHNFFPDSFDFSTLEPNNREFNFELAFTTAERLADADQLLEVGDMILMGNRPDSKCVFTYVQSLYNKLRKFEKPLKPLSPIKPVVKVMEEIVEVSANSTPPPSSGK